MGAKAREHTQGRGGTQTQGETRHKDERRKEVVVEHIFLNLKRESGKRKAEKL